MTRSVPVWVVRGGNYNELASQVAQKQAVALGWATTLNMAEISTRDALRERMEEIQPGSGTRGAVSQMFRFAKDIQDSDFILTPEKATKVIHVSRCTGAYRFDPSVFSSDYPHVRPVKYLFSIERETLPVTVRNILGGLLTVFRADNALPFIQPPDSSGDGPDPPPDDAEPDQWADEIEGQARGQILEALDEIEHHDFQLFVAGLLEALGYKSKVGQKGKDGGVDVLAFPDVFGLASPRIKVQVKNQKALAGIKDVGYLHGVLGAGERGLFVCTGGFSRDAQNAPFVRDGRVALIDGHQLLDLILQHYEEMPRSAQSLLPLRRVYVSERPSAS